MHTYIAMVMLKRYIVQLYQELSWVQYLAKGLELMKSLIGGQPLYLICHSQPMTMIPTQYPVKEYKSPTSSMFYLPY